MRLTDPSRDISLQENGQSGPPDFANYYNNPANGGGYAGGMGTPQMPTGPTQGGDYGYGNMPTQTGPMIPQPSAPNYGTMPRVPGPQIPSGSANQWSPDYIRNYISSRSGGRVNASSPDYWMSKKAELDARGQQIGNPNYANDRLAAADEIIGGPQNSPYRESGQQGGMNLSWLLQLLASRMNQPQIQAPQIQAPQMSTPQMNIQDIIAQAMRGY